MSSRAEHYRRAESILAPLDKREREGNGLGPMGPNLISLAQVHATLAAAPAEEAGEAAHTSPDPGVDYRADSDRLASLVGRLVRLAADLEDAGPSHVAQRIREELSR